MKSNVTALITWLSETTLKQRLVLGIGGFLMIGMIGLGIYTLLPNDATNPNATSSDKTVNVQDINTAQTQAVTSAPAETKVVEAQAVTGDNSTVVESNVTTVETPEIATEPSYSSADTGGRYEAVQDTTPVSEPATETTTVSEPASESAAVSTPAASEPASSDSGWNGDLGATAGDSTGNSWGDGSGTGFVSN